MPLNNKKKYCENIADVPHELLIIRMNGVRPEVGCRFIFRMIFFKEEKDEVIKRKKKGMRPLLEGSLTDVRRGRKWNIIGRIKDGDIPFFSADIVDTLRFSA